MNEESIDIIITNLKIIAQLKLNEKLCIRKGHLYIDSSSNYQFIKRWFYRDSRDIILLYIKDLIHNISHFIYERSKDYSKSDCQWIFTRILMELENSEKGLTNLKRTYILDPYMVATIENTILKFNELLTKGRSILI